MSDFYTVEKNDIADTYSRIRTRHQRDLSERREKIFTEIPELAALEEQQASLRTSMLRRIIYMPAEDVAEFKREQKLALNMLSKKKQRLLQAHGYTEADLLLTYDCPVCRDTGSVNGKRCECYKKHLHRLLYRQSSLGEVLQRENFETFSLDHYSREKDAATGYVPYDMMKNILPKMKRFAEDYKTSHRSIYFYGETGLGKTFLCHCIAKDMMDCGHTVLYVTANELFQQILSPYLMSSDPEIKDNLRPVYKLIHNADLLCIDDLGTELANSFTISQLFEVINHRILADRSTIISSNMSPRQIKQSYNDRIYSRIVEHYEMYQLFGRSIRTEKWREYAETDPS